MSIFLPIFLPIVSLNIAPPPPVPQARRFHSSISAAIATIVSPPDSRPLFRYRSGKLPKRQVPAFAAMGVRSDGTISAHRGGVNWKMGKIAGG
jgi:hypothetical protein